MVVTRAVILIIVIVVCTVERASAFMGPLGNAARDLGRTKMVGEVRTMSHRRVAIIQGVGTEGSSSSSRGTSLSYSLVPMGACVRLQLLLERQ